MFPQEGGVSSSLGCTNSGSGRGEGKRAPFFLTLSKTCYFAFPFQPLPVGYLERKSASQKLEFLQSTFEIRLRIAYEPDR